MESPNPTLGLYSATTRQDRKGFPKGGWYPRERLSREEAFHAFTIGAAFAAFEEDVKGALSPGRMADFVVWSGDPMTCPAEELPALCAIRTVIGGETVFLRG